MLVRKLLLLALVVATAHSAAIAHAGEPTETREWYGSKLLAVDLASLTLVAPTMGASASGYLIGGPLIHTRERGPARGLLSAGLRVGLPTAGVGLALATQPDDSPPLHTLVRAYGFGLLGALGAVALDTAFAHKPVAVQPAASGLVSPALNLGPRGATLGLSGQF
jgi:ABC-type sulfate transport system permease component